MVPPIIEPIAVGVIVSLINRYIIGINIFSSCTSHSDNCSEDDISSTSTACSDDSIFSHQHIHIM